MNDNPTQIAISTAKIFRGITVDRNGVILTQNARATRSQKGQHRGENKVGEKSRQAAKIDKAKDLIDGADDGMVCNVSAVVYRFDLIVGFV